MQTKNICLEVSTKEAGKTLLAFLRENLTTYPSVKSIKRAIDRKQCKINGRVELFSTHPVCCRDQIEINLSIPMQKKSPLEILFEDEHLFFINKSPGYISETLTEHFLVHRLDKDTSGVMLFAKTEAMQEALQELFAQREITKQYLAICDRPIVNEEWTMDNYLEKKVSYQGGCIYGVGLKGKGKRAITKFRRLRISKEASLIEAIPITGRTHQIRVHLKRKGHPVLGDWQYAKFFTCSYHASRNLLHSQKMVFVHPFTKKTLEVEAPLHKDFLQAEKTLFGHN